MPKKPKKLQVRAETLRLLTEKQLKATQGGGHTGLAPSTEGGPCTVMSTRGLCGNDH